MRKRKFTSTVLTASVLIAGALLSVPTLILPSALAEPAPTPTPKSYPVVAIQLPAPYKDAGFEAFRKQLAAIAQKKDKAALGRLISQNFFWIPDDKDTVDKTKPMIENFAKAINLDTQYGWETVEDLAADATADPYPDRAGVMCAPGGAKYDEKAAEAAETEAGIQPSDWGYPARNGLDVRQTSAKDGRPIEKLGLHLVWVYPDPAAKDDDETLRIVTPSGKVGFVMADDIKTLTTDQVCYGKEGAAWKIVGVLGTLGGQD